MLITLSYLASAVHQKLWWRCEGEEGGLLRYKFEPLPRDSVWNNEQTCLCRDLQLTALPQTPMWAKSELLLYSVFVGFDSLFISVFKLSIAVPSVQDPRAHETTMRGFVPHIPGDPSGMWSVNGMSSGNVPLLVNMNELGIILYVSTEPKQSIRKWLVQRM